MSFKKPFPKPFGRNPWLVVAQTQRCSMSTEILARRPWGILGGRCWETVGRGLTRLRRAFASHRHHKRFVADVGWPKCSQGHFMQQRASIGYAEVVFDDIRHGSPPPPHHNPEVFRIVSRRYPDGIQMVSRRYPDGIQTPSRRLVDRTST